MHYRTLHHLPVLHTHTHSRCVVYKTLIATNNDTNPDLLLFHFFATVIKSQHATSVSYLQAYEKSERKHFELLKDFVCETSVKKMLSFFDIN